MGFGTDALMQPAGSRPPPLRASDLDDYPRRSGCGRSGRSAKPEADDDWDSFQPRFTAAASRKAEVEMFCLGAEESTAPS